MDPGDTLDRGGSPSTPVAPGLNWSRVAGLSLLGLMLVHHWGLWFLLSKNRGLPLLTLLNRWDAGLYTAITQEGHRGPLWAFFPLYPGIVRGVLSIIGTAVAPAVIGCFVSTAALLAFVLLSTQPQNESSIRPTPWGFFLILYGPASFALHSHHTESTFLLLSFLALSFALRGRAVAAGLFAGLTLWTKIQGVLIGVTVLCLLFNLFRHARLSLRSVFLSMAMIAGLGFAFLGFEWVLAGNPFAFLQAQANWTHATSWTDIVRALWLGNPWQNTSAGSIHRQLWFFGSLALAFAYTKRDKYLGAYSLAALCPMFLQGEFINVFRFSSVLFPLWFWVGKKLDRKPHWFQGLVAMTLLALNHLTTKRYALDQWAY